MEGGNYLLYIPNNVLDRIDCVMKKYNLDYEKKLLIAFSGGKDSFFVSVALKYLGYTIIPVMLDIGFHAGSEGISLLKSYGVVTELIDCNHVEKYCTLEDIEKINYFYNMILENMNSPKTPCTPCFNAKMIMLNALSSYYEVTNVVFGHHGTDAVTSLLKSYLMYIDKCQLNHISFDRDLFFKTVLSYKNFFTTNLETFMSTVPHKQIISLLNQGLISTDEPIRQKYNDFYAIRPLFFVLESEIKEIVSRENINFPTAECFRTGIRNPDTVTPREFIQEKICNSNQTNKKILLYLIEIIEKNLDSDGQLIHDARRNRTHILGSEYEQNLQICRKF